MKKTLCSLTIVLGMTMAVVPVFAQGDGTLPEENSPFWSLMTQLQRPDDPDCDSLAEALLDSQGVPQAALVAQGMCDGVGQMITSMQPAMTAEGVSTNLFDQTDWHHITDLYFEHPQGKIQFTQEIDFMSYDFMIFLQTLTDRLDISKEEIELDADIVDGLRSAGAILTMKNVSNFTDPEILVNGKSDKTGVVSSLVYDKAADTITFNAAHFTTFKAVEKNQGEKPSIKKVKTRRYLNKQGKGRIELTITGRHFDEDVDVLLGGKEAYKVKRKASYKIIALFKTSDLEKMDNKLSLRVVNPGDMSKKYAKKINLKKIK